MEYYREVDDVTFNPGNGADDLHALTYTYIYIGLPGETLWGLGALCTVTTLLSIVGNLSVIIVLTVGKRSRTDLSEFLVNLAVADIIMAIFCMPFTFTTALNDNQWIFGQPLCTLVLYMQTASVTASVATSMAIAVDRYLAITRPFRAKTVVARHGTVLGVIWTVSFATSAVQLFVAKTKTVEIDLDLTVTVCQEEWPEPKQTWTRGYTIFVFTVTYLFPLVIIALTYVSVCRKLWNRKCPGNADHVRDSNQLRSTRKIVKMLVTVVMMFGVCWLPLHLFNIHQDLDKTLLVHENDTWAPAAEEAGDEGDYDGDADDRRFATFMAVHWLAMSNSFVNPIIYGFLNDAFRSDLKHLASSFLSCIRRRGRRRRRPSFVEAEPAFTPQLTLSDRNFSSRSSKNTWPQGLDRSSTTTGNGSLAAKRTSRRWRPTFERLPPHHHKSGLAIHHQQLVYTDPQVLILALDTATHEALIRGQRLRTAIEDN